MLPLGFGFFFHLFSLVPTCYKYEIFTIHLPQSSDVFLQLMFIWPDEWPVNVQVEGNYEFLI